MSEDERSLEFAIEVPGTPEEVWRAIATGPGISSWYVPHTVDERPGGSATATFGDGPGMEVAGRVAAWEPPHRIVFDGGEGVPGLAFEWLVEARDGGSCVVRLVNTGFGSGAEWDAQYDGMAEGWPIFLVNLRLHLEHFAGRTATASLPLGVWPGSPDEVWRRASAALGIPAAPQVGERVVVHAEGTPTLAGVVADVGARRVSLLVDDPAPGTAVVVAEAYGADSGLSVWSYLYGPQGAAAADRDRPGWQAWLSAG